MILCIFLGWWFIDTIWILIWNFYFSYTPTPQLEILGPSPHQNLQTKTLVLIKWQATRVAKSDTTHKPNMINLFINKSWVEAKRVRVIIRLTQLTHLINRSGSCSTCEPVWLVNLFSLLSYLFFFIFYFLLLLNLWLFLYVYYYIYSFNCILILDIWKLIKII